MNETTNNKVGICLLDVWQGNVNFIHPIPRPLHTFAWIKVMISYLYIAKPENRIIIVLVWSIHFQPVALIQKLLLSLQDMRALTRAPWPCKPRRRSWARWQLWWWPTCWQMTPAARSWTSSTRRAGSSPRARRRPTRSSRTSSRSPWRSASCIATTSSAPTSWTRWSASRRRWTRRPWQRCRSMRWSTPSTGIFCQSSCWSAGTCFTPWSSSTWPHAHMLVSITFSTISPTASSWRSCTGTERSTDCLWGRSATASTNCWTKERFNLSHLTSFTSRFHFLFPRSPLLYLLFASRLPLSSSPISMTLVVTSCCCGSMRELDCLSIQWIIAAHWDSLYHVVCIVASQVILFVCKRELYQWPKNIQ